MHEDGNEKAWQSPADLKNLPPEAFADVGLPTLVYVREVLAGDLKAEVGGELPVPADTKLYAVHAANGTRMAVVDDRATAFAGARQYDLEPLSVH